MASVDLSSKLGGMRVLVTGALGAIGDALVRTLRQHGATVLGMDLRFPPNPRLFDGFFCADIRDGKSVEHAIREADAVVHLAAWVHSFPKNPSEIERLFAVNQTSTERMASICAEQSKRLVFSSTVAVYGESVEGRLDESAPTCPETPYAKSKLAGEGAVLGAGGIVLRLPMVYGALDRGNMHQMVRAIARRWFVVPGNGKARRSLLGRWNAAQAFACVLAMARPTCQLFHAADDEVIAVGELAELVASLADARPPWHVPLPLMEAAGLAGSTFARMTRVHPPLTREVVRKLTRELVLQDTLIRDEIGYAPVCTLRSGLEEEVDWWRKGEPF